MTITSQDIINYRDRDWVQANADKLFAIIDGEMRDPDRVRDAAYRILHIFPQLITQVSSLYHAKNDIKGWARLIDNVLRKLDISPNNRDPLRPEYVFHPLCVIQRIDHTTKVKQKTRRRRFRLNPRKMFESYLIIVMYLHFYDEMGITAEIITDLMGLARKVNSQHHYHKVYQLMAIIYAEGDSPDRATNFVTLAFDYFDRTENDVEVGLTALIIARISAAMNDPDKVSYWLEIASRQIPEKDYPLQHEEIGRLNSSA